MAFVSPGVYWREQDFSDYAENLATAICGMVGGGTWGPVLEDTLVTNIPQMTNTFGIPTKDDLGLYAASRYLRRGSQLRYVRVASSAAAKATKMVTEDPAIHPSPKDVMLLEALYKGTYGDTIQVTIAEGSGSDYYNVTVNVVVDQAGNRADVELFEDVRIADTTSGRYIETIINEGTTTESPSSYITVDVQPDGQAGSIPILDTVQILTGGNDGLSILSGDYVTGLDVFSNTDAVDINMLSCPGASDPSVVNKIFDVCGVARMDSLGLIDPPMGLDPQGVADWTNGAAPYTHAAFNTSYASCQWPWVYVTDEFNGGEIRLPPSGFMSEVIAYNDYVAEPWYAPAGLNRGKINALRAEYIPSQGERDFLYSGGNVVNPIATFPQDGIAVYGQRTMSRRSSALNRINVRRLLLYLEKVIATSVRYLVFEPNDEVTWKAFTNIVEPAVEDVKKRRGLYDFRVICDESTNTSLTINRNEMYGKVLLKPTKTAEMIIVDFSVLETGANFAEFS